MKTQPLLAPEQQAEAVRLVRGGMSQRAVARKFGVSQPTIKKYLDAAEPAAPAPPEQPAAPAIDPNATALEIARALLAGATAGLAAARAAGDGALLQRHGRDAANLAVLIARLERETRGSDDMVSCPKSAIDDAIRSINEKGRAVADVPLVCAECGRTMRRRLAEQRP